MSDHSEGELLDLLHSRGRSSLSSVLGEGGGLTGRRAWDEFVSVEGRRGKTAREGRGRVGQRVDERRRSWKLGGVGRSWRERISGGGMMKGVVGRGVIGGGFARRTTVGADGGVWTRLRVGEGFDLVGGESGEMVSWPRSVGSDLKEERGGSQRRDASRAETKLNATNRSSNGSRNARDVSLRVRRVKVKVRSRVRAPEQDRRRGTEQELTVAAIKPPNTPAELFACDGLEPFDSNSNPTFPPKAFIPFPNSLIGFALFLPACGLNSSGGVVPSADGEGGA